MYLYLFMSQISENLFYRFNTRIVKAVPMTILLGGGSFVFARIFLLRHNYIVYNVQHVFPYTSGKRVKVTCILNYSSNNKNNIKLFAIHKSSSPVSDFLKRFFAIIYTALRQFDVLNVCVYPKFTAELSFVKISCKPCF